MRYDFIGDIHGYAGLLEQILFKLGYQTEGESYVVHEEDCKVVFLGDYIDRGPQNRRVIEIARSMTEKGRAIALMGNHEFNAICYHTLRHQATITYGSTHPKIQSNTRLSSVNIKSIQRNW